MFKETIPSEQSSEMVDKHFTPEELSDFTFDEIFEKLGLVKPEPKNIQNFSSYMEVQREVMEKLVNEFHDQQTALEFYTQKLASEFDKNYRHSF